MGQVRDSTIEVGKQDAGEEPDGGARCDACEIAREVSEQCESEAEGGNVLSPTREVGDAEEA